MELKLMHLYPDLMSLSGSYANVLALRRSLEALGNTVTVETVRPEDEADLSSADFLFMGAGTERRQKAALADFAPKYGEAVKAAAEAGVSMLFAGTAMELLGKTIVDAEGKSYDGIGLGGFTSTQGKRRIVEDVLGKTDLFPEPVVGFINKCSVVTGVEPPLLTELELGFGNEKALGAEGFRYKNVLASQLTGPILVKNPRLLDAVVDAIYQRHGETVPADRPHDHWAEDGWKITAEELKKRIK